MEPATSEVKGERSDHCVTETPLWNRQYTVCFKSNLNQIVECLCCYLRFSDSIMALYQPSQKQANPQMFGVPGGVYLQQQQQQQQMNAMAMNRPQGMAPQYNTQQQMVAVPRPQQQRMQMYQV